MRRHSLWSYPVTLIVLWAIFVMLAAARPVLAGQALPKARNGFTPIPLHDIVQIAAGGAHTCALTGTGGVKCWGEIEQGPYYGDGRISTRDTAVDIAGLTSGVSAISVGGVYYYEYACALTSDGKVKCWGDNNRGQLGNGSGFSEHLTPVDVVDLNSNVAAITTGAYHACALLQDGGVKCWGDNDDGQLGDGTNSDRKTPTDVVGLDSGVNAITAGGSHTCALTISGSVKCWGDNRYGQLGNGSTTSQMMPVDVVGLSSGVYHVVAGGDHTCAVLDSGDVKCWGNNQRGQLGDGTTVVTQTMPVNVLSLGGEVSSVLAGDSHTCAVLTANSVQCWGDNRFGQLGDGTSVLSRTLPVDVIGLSTNVSALAAGGVHTCVLSGDNVQCWGSNSHGQLGNAMPSTQLLPVDVVGLSSGVSAINTYGVRTCALLESRRVTCWGDSSPIPTEVTGIVEQVSAIAVGSGFTCILTLTGSVQCWGVNGVGQLGDGTTTDRPVPGEVMGLGSGVKAIAAGGGHACALTSQNGVKCWGHNYRGQLGDGTEVYSRTIPVDPVGLTSGVRAIAVGGEHTCAALDSGGAKCWGNNFDGRLGADTTTVFQYSPIAVEHLTSTVDAIAAGHFHTCVLTDGGGVKCWGAVFGRAVDVEGLTSGVTAIAAGASFAVNEAALTHTCAVLDSGALKCWGDNFFGVLGDGSERSSYTPVDVVGLGGEISAVAAGWDHTCALTTSGGVKCWGDNRWGQLGASSGWSSIPVEVVERPDTYLPLLMR